jgi:hypothetical protein
MKVCEVLTEALGSVDADGVVSQIKRSCQPFLSQCEEPMWRGLSHARNAGTIFSTVATEQFRSPRDTPAIINTYMMSYLNKKFKIPFRQQHTIFTTGSEGSASSFGTPFMVFPIGQFDYCWSHKVRDLTDQFHHLTGQKLSAREIAEEVYDSMDRAEYKLNEDLTTAVFSYKEIMIYCKSYYILDMYALMRDQGWYADGRKMYKALFLGGPWPVQ